MDAALAVVPLRMRREPLAKWPRRWRQRKELAYGLQCLFGRKLLGGHTLTEPTMNAFAASAMTCSTWIGWRLWSSTGSY